MWLPHTPCVLRSDARHSGAQTIACGLFVDKLLANRQHPWKFASILAIDAPRRPG